MGANKKVRENLYSELRDSKRTIRSYSLVHLLHASITVPLLLQEAHQSDQEHACHCSSIDFPNQVTSCSENRMTHQSSLTSFGVECQMWRIFVKQVAECLEGVRDHWPSIITPSQ